MQPPLFTLVYGGECKQPIPSGANPMNGIIYLVGLIVVVLFILSVLGLR
jgi:hypothetical protein